MRSELSDSLDHFMQAAVYGAGAVGAATGPRWESTKSAVAPRVEQVRDAASTSWDTTRSAVSPLVAAALAGAADANKQARKSAKKAKKKVNHKMDRLHKKQSPSRGKRVAVGLLAVGVVAGAGAALVARRRNRAKWDEYDASFDTPSALDTTRDAGAAGQVAQTTESWRDSATDKTVSMADKARNAADKAGDKAGDAKDQVATRAGDAKDQAAAKAEELANKAASAAKNSRN